MNGMDAPESYPEFGERLRRLTADATPDQLRRLAAALGPILANIQTAGVGVDATTSPEWPALDSPTERERYSSRRA